MVTSKLKSILKSISFQVIFRFALKWGAISRIVLLISHELFVNPHDFEVVLQSYHLCTKMTHFNEASRKPNSKSFQNEVKYVRFSTYELQAAERADVS